MCVSHHCHCVHTDRIEEDHSKHEGAINFGLCRILLWRHWLVAQPVCNEADEESHAHHVEAHEGACATSHVACLQKRSGGVRIAFHCVA